MTIRKVITSAIFNKLCVQVKAEVQRCKANLFNYLWLRQSSFAFRFYYEVGFWLLLLNKKSQRHGSYISPPISWLERFSICMCVCIHARVHNYYPIGTKFGTKVGLANKQVKFEDGLSRSHRDSQGAPPKSYTTVTFQPQA